LNLLLYGAFDAVHGKGASNGPLRPRGRNFVSGV
jgi:hypothetical protein